MLSGRGLCDELITRPEESYQLCCIVVCDLETSRMGAPYIYDISRLRFKVTFVSEFSGTVREIRLMFRANFIPDFVPFFIFPILFRLRM